MHQDCHAWSGYCSSMRTPIRSPGVSPIEHIPVRCTATQPLLCSTVGLPYLLHLEANLGVAGMAGFTPQRPPCRRWPLRAMVRPGEFAARYSGEVRRSRGGAERPIQDEEPRRVGRGSQTIAAALWGTDASPATELPHYHTGQRNRGQQQPRRKLWRGLDDQIDAREPVVAIGVYPKPEVAVTQPSEVPLRH